MKDFINIMNSPGLKYYFIVGFALTLILTPFMPRQAEPNRRTPAVRTTEQELADSLSRTSFGR